MFSVSFVIEFENVKTPFHSSYLTLIADALYHMWRKSIPNESCTDLDNKPYIIVYQ